MRNFRQNRGVFSLFMLIGLAVIVAAIMLLWNYLIPSIIGWTTINYWQALGLFVLTRLLFGGFHGHGFMRPPGKPEHYTIYGGKSKICLRKNAGTISVNDLKNANKYSTMTFSEKKSQKNNPRQWISNKTSLPVR